MAPENRIQMTEGLEPRLSTKISNYLSLDWREGEGDVQRYKKKLLPEGGIQRIQNRGTFPYLDRDPHSRCGKIKSFFLNFCHQKKQNQFFKKFF